MNEYGIVGNCKTCALVNNKSSINWFCFPSFDSPSVFAKILDDEKGGSFEIIPKGRYSIKQEYAEDTNVLETHFTSKKASFVVIDFFPRYNKILPNQKRKTFRQNRLIRIIRIKKGKPVIKIKYEPKMNYARGKNKFKIVDDNLMTYNKDKKISLISNVDYDKILNQEFIELETTKYFVIGDKEEADDFNVRKCMRLFSSTKSYWRRWVNSLETPERNKKEITRSALALKLLTYSETGAILAAATTSLPEEIGSERNWDYRFCWIRDASLTADAFKKVGRDYESKKLMEFILNNTIGKKKHMQIMYGIRGETELTEKKLNHLKGHKSAKPVRVGNAAYYQKQNDIYGSIIDVMYLYYVYYEFEKKMPKKFWRFLKYLVKEIEDNWDTKDSGIWEFRGMMHHFTYSKLMCYVGADRAIKIARHYGEEKLEEKWRCLKDKIKADIIENAWNEKVRSFTLHYGSDAADASLLQMNYHDFLESDDPRMVNTIKYIDKKLNHRGLVQRYDIKDDFGNTQNAFTICAFWLVDALYNIGKKQKAISMFKKLKGYSNHLGLYSEDVEMKTKKLMGNFPQAYVHIALINSSILLSEWSQKRRKVERYKRVR